MMKNKNDNSKDKAVSEAAKIIGQRGGLKTAATHDKEYFRNIGKLGVEAREQKRKMGEDLKARYEARKYEKHTINIHEND
jgi:general stress protein YciG